jgi:membrane-bound ClpP family serine protease
MIIAIMIILFIVGMTLLMIAAEECSDSVGWVGVIMMVISLVMLIFRMFSWIYKSSKDRRYTSRCYNCC